MKIKYSPFLTTFVLLTCASWVQAQTNAAKQRELTLQIFFTNQKHPDFATTCGAGDFVVRKVPATRRVADAALRALFKGPTTEEAAIGMEKIPKLADYYLGVSIKRDTAIVNFRSGAQEHLYTGGPACMQETVLTPIQKTLTKLAGIKEVQIAINGKIFEEWDA